MGVEDAHAVGVVHGQGGDGPLGFIQLQVFHDAVRVGPDISVALPHEFGAAGRAAGGQKQPQLGIQLRFPAKGRFQQVIAQTLIHRLAAVPREILRGPQKRRVIGFVQALKQLPIHFLIQQHGHHAALHEARVAQKAAQRVAAQVEGQAAPPSGGAQRVGFPLELAVGQARAVLIHKRRPVPEALKVPHHTSSVSPFPFQKSSGQ